MDLGACPKMHSERLKSEYEEAKKRKECDYEAEFERNLANFVADCDRKIASAQKRLDKTPEDSAKVTQLVCIKLIFVSSDLHMNLNFCYCYISDRQKRSKV
jgi:hypothetical protein